MRMTSRKGFLAAVSLAAIGSVIAACGGSGEPNSGTDSSASPTSSTAEGSSPGDGDASGDDGEDAAPLDLSDLSIDYASADDSIGLFKTVGDGMVKHAEALGIQLHRYDNQLDGQTALRNAQLMVQNGPDIAVSWNTVVGVSTSIGRTFTEAGIPCLAVNQQIPGCAWFNLSNAQMGIDSAEVVIPIAEERGWDGSNTTILMVIASANGEEVNSGVKSFYLSLAEALPDFEQPAPEEITLQTTQIGGTNGVQIDCKSTLDGAYNAAKNVLPNIPDGNNIIIIGADTDCSLGAYRAAVDAGRDSTTLACGNGGTPEGLQQLRTNENWVCEGSLFLDQWSSYILAEAVAISNGVTPPELTPAPQIVLTKDNVDTYFDGNDSILLPPLVEDNKYLLETGVLQALGTNISAE